MRFVGIGNPFSQRFADSYCKAFGLDLRSSIIGGSAKHISAIRLKHSEGIGIISRILQGAFCGITGGKSSHRGDRQKHRDGVIK